VGTGTTAIAAAKLDRRCVGYDISEKYIDLAEQRVRAASAASGQMPFDNGYGQAAGLSE
jgi:DNA modification methylase